MSELTKSTAGAGPAQTASAAAPAEPAIARVTQWGEIRHRFLANKLAVIGLVLVALLFVVAIFAPLLSPHDPYAQDLNNTLASPGGAHLLGTDALGRDQLSRILYGSRIAVVVGLAS